MQKNKYGPDLPTTNCREMRVNDDDQAVISDSSDDAFELISTNYTNAINSREVLFHESDLPMLRAYYRKSNLRPMTRHLARALEFYNAKFLTRNVNKFLFPWVDFSSRARFKTADSVEIALDAYIGHNGRIVKSYQSISLILSVILLLLLREWPL
jgi:hypothetical protein